jgi:hypothetical protein
MRPSLHFSHSGTSMTGRAALILEEQKNSGWQRPASLRRYLRFTQVVDLGSEETILASTPTSLLGDLRRFLKIPGYTEMTSFLRLG